jgi:hypothetical protein
MLLKESTRLEMLEPTTFIINLLLTHRILLFDQSRTRTKLGSFGVHPGLLVLLLQRA